MTIGDLRVLLLGDDELDAKLITSELEAAGMAVTTQRASSAESFATALRAFDPDIVLSDHSLAQFDSDAALKVLRDTRPAVPLIIVARTLTGAQSVAAMRSGADDLVLKDYASRLPASIKSALAIRRPLQKLTTRQLEVLRLVAEGHRTRDIANRLGLSVKTVESHRGEIMKRLGMHDVVNLVHYSIRVGLIPTNF